MQLAEQGLFPRLTALETQEQAINQQQDLAGLLARRDEMLSGAVGLERQRAHVEAEFRTRALTELGEVDKRIAALAQEILKADQRRGLQTQHAPIDGVVQQLAVHTLGGVVTAAQVLMMLAAPDDQLEVEAMVLNRDIGFLAVGQKVAIKLDAFLFTKYGTVPGRLVSISRDAVKDDKLGLVYAARISLDTVVVDVAGRPAQLGAGMTVTAEIKTDTRRFIEYLLSPILRYQQESVRER